MDYLEINLKLFCFFVQVFNLWIPWEFFRHVDCHEEFWEIGALFQGIEVFQQEIVDGIYDFSISIEQAILPVFAKIALIGENFEELWDMEDDISGWCLFGVKVSFRIEVLKYFKDKVAQLESVIFIQIY